MATLVLGPMAVIFAILGTWQVDRAVEKEAIEQLHQSAGTQALEEAIGQESRFARVKVSGFYDQNRHFLLDNQIWQGRAGVFVFTPFYSKGGKSLLVNRGWLPMSLDRKTMPEILTPKSETVLRGMLNTLPVPGRRLGAADKLTQDQWPQLVTYLNIADISESLERPMENWIIQLSKTESDGFAGRDWKPVFMSSKRHRAYAFQWYALVAATITMWIVMGYRKPPENQQ